MNPFALKMIAGLGAVLLVLLVIADRNRLAGKLDVAQGRLEVHCQLVRQIADNPKLACKDSERQLQASVQTMHDFRATAGRINAAVARLQADAKRLADAADKARQAVAGRVQAGKRATAALEASARAPARQAAPCEPSDELKRRWKS